MKFIKAFDGENCLLSDDLYVVTSEYKRGAVVRLIIRQKEYLAGKPVGSHYDKQYLTVHAISEKKVAKFCGIRKSALIKLPQNIIEE